jgi:hypothetical protein
MNQKGEGNWRKLTACLPHVQNHWCGDDFDYENEKFAAKEPLTASHFKNFQPETEKMYVINHRHEHCR